MELFSETWQYLLDADNWTGAEGLVARLLEQLLLTATALAAAMLLGLPLALWLGHLGKGGFLAVNISNVGRAVPTFALLAILVAADWPGSAEFGPYGRAGLATLIALVLFALPPLITNGYVGMREVPSDVQEAADGMGMSSVQRFRRVELPLALPVVASGVRLALVQVWATATIAALVAGPGLGRIITRGFANHRTDEVVAGALLVAVGALILEGLAVLVERYADPMRRARRRPAKQLPEPEALV